MDNINHGANVMSIPQRLPFAFLLMGLVFSHAGYAASNDAPRLGTAIYSDLCVSQQSNDLHGTRITLRRLADGDMLIYEYNDGSTHALVGEGLAVDSKSGAVQFAVHNPDGGMTQMAGQFTGGGRALTLKTPLFGDPKRVYTLARVDNPAAAAPACK
jgi:hypothetical protein